MSELLQEAEAALVHLKHELAQCCAALALSEANAKADTDELKFHRAMHEQANGEAMDLALRLAQAERERDELRQTVLALMSRSTYPTPAGPPSGHQQ